MQEFSVRGEALITCKREFDCIATALNNCLEQVSSVKRRLNYNLKSKTVIDRSLNAITANLSGCASKLCELGEKLSEAERKYEVTENRLLAVSAKNARPSSKPSASGAGEETDKESLIEKLYKQFEGIFKGIDKISDDRDAAVASTLISYITSLFNLITGDSDNPADTWSDWFKLADKSAALENGIYNYFEKGMDPYGASKLYEKYGGKMMYLSIIGDLFGLVGDGLSFKSVYDNPESSIYKIRSELFRFWGSGFKVIGNTYVATEYGSKALRFVSPEGLNQILTTPKLKFEGSSAMKANAKKAGAYLAIGDVIFSTAAGGYEKYGECIQDGKIDARDVGSIGTRGACDGISSVASGLTFGIVNIDGEQMANNLENRADNFIKNGSNLANYISDQSNPAIFRFAAAEVAAVELVAQEAADGIKYGLKKVTNGAKSIASWIKQR